MVLFLCEDTSRSTGGVFFAPPQFLSLIFRAFIYLIILIRLSIAFGFISSLLIFPKTCELFTLLQHYSHITYLFSRLNAHPSVDRSVCLFILQDIWSLSLFNLIPLLPASTTSFLRNVISFHWLIFRWTGSSFSVKISVFLTRCSLRLKVGSGDEYLHIGLRSHLLAYTFRFPFKMCVT